MVCKERHDDGSGVRCRQVVRLRPPAQQQAQLRAPSSSSSAYRTFSHARRAVPLAATLGALQLHTSSSERGGEQRSMAAAAAAPPGAPAPWHERLQAGVADVERAAAALLAVCEEPDEVAALEVRARAAHASDVRRIARGPSACAYGCACQSLFVAYAAPTLLARRLVTAATRRQLC